MSDTNEAARIEHDLDRTRSRLGGHLNELQDRLSPGQVLDDLVGYFRGSEGAAFGRSLMDNVRANPMPTALTSIGLAWLMASNPRPGMAAATPASPIDRSGAAALQLRMQTAERDASKRPGESEADHATRLDTARSQALGLTRHAQETAQSFGQRVQDGWSAAQKSAAGTAQGLGDQFGSAASAASAAVQGAAHSAGKAASQGGQAAGELASNMVSALSSASPVLLGALGLAAGALLGALLPQSEAEEAALGGIAGQVRDTARDAAQGVRDQAGSVAQTVVQTGRESAETHGLDGSRSAGSLLDAALGGDLADGVQQVAHDVLGAGDKAIRNTIEHEPDAADAQPA